MSEKRLIDANALPAVRAYVDDDGMYRDIVYKEDIDAAPAVAAEPVRHGDWVRTSPATWECSVCRALYRGTPVRPKWSRYCHNCGARMDREHFVGINKTSDTKEDAE